MRLYQSNFNRVYQIISKAVVTSIHSSTSIWKTFSPTFYLTFHCLKHVFGWMCCAILSCSIMSNSVRPHGLQPARLLCPRGFSRQEYWSGLPCPPPGDLPNPGIEPRSTSLQGDSLLSKLAGKPLMIDRSFNINYVYFISLFLMISVLCILFMKSLPTPKFINLIYDVIFRKFYYCTFHFQGYKQSIYK